MGWLKKAYLNVITLGAYGTIKGVDKFVQTTQEQKKQNEQKRLEQLRLQQKISEQRKERIKQLIPFGLGGLLIIGLLIYYFKK